MSSGHGALRRLGLVLYWILSSMLLLVLVDYAIGDRLLGMSSDKGQEQRKLEQRYRVPHGYFNHALRENYEADVQWGNIRYRICTDGNGFKSACDAVGDIGLSFDLVFIGDSFTEAIGLAYEQSFVGRFAAASPGLKVANLAVASYSPSIYYSKLRYFLDRGMKTDHVIVYIDISDIHDEAKSYLVADDGSIEPMLTVAQDEAPARAEVSVDRLGEELRQRLPLISAGLLSLNELFTTEPAMITYRDRGYARSSWTYDPGSGDYGDIGVDGGIRKALMEMGRLYEMLRERGIALSVGVYPWPGQLLHDDVESRQVTLWRDFCETRCEYFIDGFPLFFEEAADVGVERVIGKYYFEGDVHLNAEGNRLLAEQLLTRFRQ